MSSVLPLSFPGAPEGWESQLSHVSQKELQYLNGAPWAWMQCLQDISTHSVYRDTPEDWRVYEQKMQPFRLRVQQGHTGAFSLDFATRVYNAHGTNQTLFQWEELKTPDQLDTVFASRIVQMTANTLIHMPWMEKTHINPLCLYFMRMLKLRALVPDLESVERIYISDPYDEDYVNGKYRAAASTYIVDAYIVKKINSVWVARNDDDLSCCVYKSPTDAAPTCTLRMTREQHHQLFLHGNHGPVDITVNHNNMIYTTAPQH